MLDPLEGDSVMSSLSKPGASQYTDVFRIAGGVPGCRRSSCDYDQTNGCFGRYFAPVPESQIDF